MKTIFDHIKAITLYKEPYYFSTLDEKEINNFNIFLLNRYMSFNNRLTILINNVANYTMRMSKEEYYKFMINYIPKGSYWLKFNKDKKDIEVPLWFLKLVEEYFIFISANDAREYTFLMDREQRKKILKAFGIKKDAWDAILNL